MPRRDPFAQSQQPLKVPLPPSTIAKIAVAVGKKTDKNIAIVNAAAEAARSRDASDRAGPPTTTRSPAGKYGSDIAGPARPITPAGQVPREITPAEITMNATQVKAAGRQRDRAAVHVTSLDKRITAAEATAKQAKAHMEAAIAAAGKRYGTNPKTGQPLLPSQAQADFLNSLIDATNTAVEAYKATWTRGQHAFDDFTQTQGKYTSAVESFQDSIQRAQEYDQAQETKGLFNPSKAQLDQLKAIEREKALHPHRDFGDTLSHMGDIVTGAVPYAVGGAGVAGRVLGTQLAEVPGVGSVTRRIPGLKPYDVRGNVRGGIEGVGATAAAAAASAGPALYTNAKQNVQQTFADVASGIAYSGGDYGAARKIQQDIAPEQRPASFIPTDLASMTAKAALGGPFAVEEVFRHPQDAIPAILHEAIEITRGATQTLGMAVALASPDESLSSKFHMARDTVLVPAWQDVVDKYGADVTIDELRKGAHKQPLIYGLNAAAVLAAAARVGVLFYGTSRGLTVADAIRAIHSPEAERLLTLRGAPSTVIRNKNLPRRFGVGPRPAVLNAEGKPYLTPEGSAEQVPLPWSRSPTNRWIVNRPYDAISRWIEGSGARRVPVIRAISENSRAARQLQRNNDRDRRRLPAWARGMMHAVDQALKDQPEMKLALSLLLQKPTDFTDEEWMDSILTNLKHMEASGEFIGPEGRPSPAAARLIASIRRNEGRSERARVKRQGRASRRISSEQLRLATDLDSLAAHRQLLLEERAAIKADTSLSDEDKALWLRESDLELRANTAQRDVAREHLDDLSIHLDPIEDTPERVVYREELAKVPRIGGGEMPDLGTPNTRPATTRVVQPDPDLEAPPMMGHVRLYRTEDGWTPDREQAGDEPLEHVDLTSQEWRALPEADDEGMLQLPDEIAARAESGNAYQVKLWDEYEALRDKETPRTPVESRRFKELDKYFRQPRSKAAIEASRGRLEADALARRREELGDNQAQLLDDGMMISDLFARRWGERHNRNPADFYKEGVQLRYDATGEGIPEDAFFQTRKRKRAPAEGMRVDPETKLNRVTRGYWNNTHRDLVVNLEREEARLDDVKARVKADEKKAKDDATKFTDRSPEYKEAQKAHAFAKEVELEARVWYGSQTQKGTITRNAERRALARRLVKDYSGRKGALPTRFRTPDGLEKLMSMLDELTTQGVDAQYWYENSAEAILRLAHGDRKLAAKLAQLVAIYSPQKAVIPNLGEAIKAYASWRGNHPITNGHDWQQDAAYKVLEEIEGWDGRKTNNFYRNFLEDIDPALFKSEREKILADPSTKLKDRKAWEGGVTSDMWMARVFGYLGTTVSEGRYDVIEDIVRQLASERKQADGTPWKPKHVQAAIWTAVKDKSDDISANVDFAGAISHHYGVVNWEAAPGDTYVGPFAEVYASWDEPTKRAFLAANVAAVDDFLAHAGILSRRNEFGPGIFKRDAAPGARFRFVAGGRHEPGSKKKEIPWSYDTTPDDRQLFNFVAAAIGRATLQNAMPWVRGFEAKTRGHGDAMFLNLGRRLTDEEAAKLYDILNPDLDPDNERVFVVHAGPNGVLLRKATWLNDWSNYIQRTKVKKGEEDAPLYKDSFQGVVTDAVAQVFPDLPPEARTLDYLATDGEYIANDWAKGSADYERWMDSATGDAGDPRSGVRLRESADRLALQAEQIRRDFTDDPGGAAVRANDELGRRDRSARRRGLDDPAAERGPPRALAQTRQEALLGASAWLDTAPGQRIIYLTEQADISTLLHELIGHGVYEMKAFHPEEFVKVEQHIGRPLEQWTREDHETFARWAERYFHDGEPPTPELVDVMDRLKSWMRAIYGGMAKTLGGRMPTEVRVLFDTFFGAYDDENVFRTALNMGREGWGVEDLDIQRYGDAMVVSQEELRALKKRQESTRARKSVLGMRVQLADLEKQLDELRRAPGIDGTAQSKFTREQERKVADLSAQILAKRNNILLREDKREKNLRKKIDLLEKAMSRGFDNRRFQGALYAMQQISQAREEILRETFGRDFGRVFGESFEDRRDLLADWLVERGLLRPDFQRGTAYYFPYSAQDPSLLPPQTPGQPLTGRVVGRSKTDQLNLYKRNQMILWQQGNWMADPNVLMESYLRALSFSWMNEIKQQLWKLGRKLTPVEAGSLGSNVYLINLNGTPISRDIRSQLKAGAEGDHDLSVNHDPQSILDAVDGTDNDRLEHSLKSYWDNVMIDGESVPPDFNLLNPDGEMRDEIRVVPKEVVHALLRPLRGGRSAGGKGLDIATTMARFSLIYANAPAYMISNAVGNIGLLLATKPWQIAKMSFNARKLLGDPKIAFRIYAETGDMPAFAAVSRGRSFDIGSVDASVAINKLETNWLKGLSTVDKYPRALAWIGHAGELGYRKNDDIIALLDGKTEKTRRDRLRVSEAATNAMIDFNKLRPWEQLYLTRALFIWPFVRGSTAWPFWYAKNYPERTAVLANVALTAEERRQEMLEQGGPLPRRMEGLFPIRTEGTGKYRTAQVINANVISPTSTLMGELEAGGDVANYVLGLLGHGDGNEEPVSALLDMISPVATTILEIATQRNDWGQALGPGDILGDIADTFVPFLRLYNAQAGDNPLWGENRSPRAFLEDTGPGDQRRRTFIRLAPQTLTIQYANAQGMKHGDKPVGVRIEQAEKLSRAGWKKSNPGEPWPAGAKRAIVMRLMYEDRVKERAREQAGRGGTPPFVPTKVKGTTDEYDFHYDVTPYERAKIAYAVAKKYMPGAEIENPDTMLFRTNTTPTSVDGKENLEDWLKFDWGDLLEPEAEAAQEAKWGEEDIEEAKRDRERERLKKRGLRDEYGLPVPNKGRRLYTPVEIPLG